MIIAVRSVRDNDLLQAGALRLHKLLVWRQKDLSLYLKQ